MNTQARVYKAPLIIVKYQNRKLYLKSLARGQSRYVTLAELTAWVREGADVRVTSKATGKDITGEVVGDMFATLPQPPVQTMLNAIRGVQAS